VGGGAAFTEAAIPAGSTGMIIDILDRHDPRQFGLMQQDHFSFTPRKRGEGEAIPR
jgi:hypothetical protein